MADASDRVRFMIEKDDGATMVLSVKTEGQWTLSICIDNEYSGSEPIPAAATLTMSLEQARLFRNWIEAAVPCRLDS